jgi:hypothetical protein
MFNGGSVSKGSEFNDGRVGLVGQVAVISKGLSCVVIGDVNFNEWDADSDKSVA